MIRKEDIRVQVLTQRLGKPGSIQPEGTDTVTVLSLCAGGTTNQGGQGPVLMQRQGQASNPKRRKSLEGKLDDMTGPKLPGAPNRGQGGEQLCTLNVQILNCAGFLTFPE